MPGRAALEPNAEGNQQIPTREITDRQRIAIPPIAEDACDGRSDFIRRTAPGEKPRKRLNARLNAASDS